MDEAWSQLFLKKKEGEGLVPWYTHGLVLLCGTFRLLVVQWTLFQLGGFKVVMPHMAAFHCVKTEPLRANVCYQKRKSFINN